MSSWPWRVSPLSSTSGGQKMPRRSGSAMRRPSLGPISDLLILGLFTSWGSSRDTATGCAGQSHMPPCGTSQAAPRVLEPRAGLFWLPQSDWPCQDWAGRGWYRQTVAVWTMVVATLTLAPQESLHHRGLWDSQGSGRWTPITRCSVPTPSQAPLIVSPPSWTGSVRGGRARTVARPVRAATADRRKLGPGAVGTGQAALLPGGRSTQVGAGSRTPARTQEQPRALPGPHMAGATLNTG